jgi:hypothetical protein
MTLREATLDAELHQETTSSPASLVSCARKGFDARVQSSKLTRPLFGGRGAPVLG